MRTCVIFNPTARGDKAKRFLRHVGDLGRDCTLMPTQRAGDAHTLAAGAVKNGFETIVAVGGDGTVNEVLNGISAVPDGFRQVRVGVLPLGTVNVFALELRIPFHLARAWEVVLRGKERLIDVPTVNFKTTGSASTSRYFVQMAGCGLDARAVELLDWELKKKIGQFAYVVAGFKALREEQPTLNVVSGQKSASGKLVLLGNGRLYGGSIPLFEQANLDDGHLDVCVFPQVNWFVVLRYVCAYVWHRFLHRGPETRFQAESVTVSSATQRCPLEIDGEHVGQVPATFRVHPRILRVIVP